MTHTATVADAENLALVIARLEQIAGNFTDDPREAAEQALVCARALAAPVGADKAAADYERRLALNKVQIDSLYHEAEKWKKIARAAGAPAETAPDKGPWRGGGLDGDKPFIESDDSTHDVRLYVNGDFASDQQRATYCANLVAALNRTAPQIDATTAMAELPGNSGVLPMVPSSMKEPSGNSGKFTAPATAPDVAKDAARLEYLIDMVPTSFELIDHKWHLLNPRGRVAGKGTTKLAAIDAAMGALPPTGAAK